MVNLRNGQRFGTVLIQQLIQINRSLRSKGSPICERHWGPAAATINGLSLSNANYDAAVTLLKERYGDPQKIINAHMDALVNLPSVENARDLQAVRRLSDEVEANVRALSALGRNAEEYGGLFP